MFLGSITRSAKQRRALSPFFALLHAALFAVACMAAMPTAALAAETCVVPNKLGVTFIIDDSGSMDTTDPGYLRADAVRIALNQLPDGTIASAGSFDSSSRTLFEPAAIDAANRSSLADKVGAGLSASGQTDYYKAFSLADTLLNATAGVDKRAVIFLSDGDPTSNAYANESMTNRDVPIYTVGFGSISSTTLDRIATYSGGKAFSVDSADAAQSAFAEIVGELNCDTPTINTTFDLAPGETRTFDFTVEFADQFNGVASWDSGGITMKLRRPDGSFLAEGLTLPDEVFSASSNSASVKSTAPAVGGWQVQLIASSDNAYGATVSMNVFNRPTQKDLPVILISGLFSNTNYVAPGPSGLTTTCELARDMESLCDALSQQRYPVWVVPQYADATNKQDLHSKEDIASNAARLVRFVKSNPGGILHGKFRPVFVGHSAGGLIARKAVSSLQVQASGIFTIGSPHDGSFLADAAAATAASCLLPGGNILRWAACKVAVDEYKKIPLIRDLTNAARKADRMNPPGVPLWTYAGTPGDHLAAKVMTEYYAPNDMAVGKSSAFGKDANLGEHGKIEGGAWHGYKWPINSSTDEIQLTSDWVARYIKNSLTELISGQRGELKVGTGVTAKSSVETRGRSHIAARKKRKTKKKGRRPTAVQLSFVQAVRKIKPSQTSVANGLVLSIAPFSLECKFGTVASSSLSSASFSATAPGKCQLVGFNYEGAIFIPKKKPRSLRATATYDHRRKTVTLKVTGAKKATIRFGKRRFKSLKRSNGKHVLSLTKRQFKRQPAFLQVQTKSGAFAAPLPAAVD